MNLFWFWNLDHWLNRLTKLTRFIFFNCFLNLFFISISNIKFIGNWNLYYFFLFSTRLFRFNDYIANWLCSFCLCNDLTQHAVYYPFWTSQSTHYQDFRQDSPHDFVLDSHAWFQNVYNMLATRTTNKVLVLDAHFLM